MSDREWQDRIARRRAEVARANLDFVLFVSAIIGLVLYFLA